MSENDQIKVLVFLKKQIEEEMKKSKALSEENQMLKNLNDESRKKIQDSQIQFEEEINSLRNQISTLNSEKEAIETETVHLGSQIQYLEDENYQLKSGTENMEKEMNSIRLEMKIALEDLQKESQEKITILVSEKESLEKTNLNLKEEIETLKKENSKVKKFVDDVTVLVSQKAMEVVRLEKLLKGQNQNSNQNSNNNNQEIENYKQKLSSIIQEKEELELNLSELKNILSTNESEIISAFLSKLSKTTGISEIEEISNPQNKVEELIEQFSGFLKTRESTAGLKQNEMKLSLSNFQPDDIVLFMKDSRGSWEIFNRNCSGYYLSLDAVDELKKKDGYKDLLSVVAKILYIEEEVSQKNNDYGFIAGRQFHRVYIYPFEK